MSTSSEQPLSSVPSSDRPLTHLPTSSPRKITLAPLLTAVFACVVFLLVQGISLAVVAGIVFRVQLQATDNPQAAFEKVTASLSQNELHPWAGLALRWGMFAAEIASILFAWLVLLIAAQRNWKAEYGFRRPCGEHLLLTFLLLLPLMLVHSAAHEFGHWLFGDSEANIKIGRMLQAIFAPWPAWLSVFVVGVGPALCEEMWCRAYLGRKLIGAYGVYLGVLFSSILFGLLHIAPAYALGTAFIGIILHYVYLCTGSLWLPILLHFLNNSLGILATLDVINFPIFQQEAKAPPTAVALAAAGVVLAISYLLYRIRWSPDKLHRPSRFTLKICWGAIAVTYVLFGILLTSVGVTANP